MASSVDIANRAIQLIGDNQSPITGSGNYPSPSFDTSPAGLACATLYVGVVNTVGRQFGWDFSRSTAALQSANIGAAVPFPWKYEYFYPGNGVQVRQLMPTTIADPNNPLPIRGRNGVGRHCAVAAQQSDAGRVPIIRRTPRPGARERC